ncbi:peptidylprolyl isomerase [Alteromonas sp. a30]|uniref:peptidylprolyl isomerase n=1 Tax=Alteromonas sp. a30 TaxID=2730917 RepID=UPI0022815468|nr:peptidylprolyl isomerase [Alteromonas sp. a30]MCY7296194.1 peptidyl-prolyl cis-trans isomerase [Alteromonas sp. a30]
MRRLALYLTLILTSLLTSQPALAVPPVLTVSDGAAIQPDNLFPMVKFETSMGNVVVELDRIKAPLAVNNFLRYVSKSSYNNTIFHRVIDNFVVQGGGYNVKYEALPEFPPIINESGNGLKNTLYSISMARKNEPHTATRQFFFNMNDNTNLDPGKDWGYTVFGQVVEGSDVLDSIAAVETAFNPDVGWRDVPVEPVVLKHVTVLPQAPLQ